jgi:hypothetical protein
MNIPYTYFRYSLHHCRGTCRCGAPVSVSLHHRMRLPWNLWKMQGKWQNGELSVLLNLFFHYTHQIFINYRRSAAPRIIMHIFAAFIKVSRQSPYGWITHGIFLIHLTKLTMNVKRFHVSLIQEMDYRPHFTCGGLLDFLEHFKHTGRCIIVVRMSENSFRAFQQHQQTLHACAP